MAANLGPLDGNNRLPISDDPESSRSSGSPSSATPNPSRQPPKVGAFLSLPTIARRAPGDPAEKSAAYSITSSGSDHSVGAITELAKKASSLEEVEEVLGIAPDGNGSAGSGIRSLPRAMQAEPTAELNLRLKDMPRKQRAPVAVLLASHTLETGGDPYALECLTRHFNLIPEGAEATTATRTLWAPVNSLPLQHRLLPLYWLVTAIKHFPASERPERFGEHLSAWEELAETQPSALRSTPRFTSPLDAFLPNMVAKLPRDSQTEARARIEAMKTTVQADSKAVLSLHHDYAPDFTTMTARRVAAPRTSFELTPARWKAGGAYVSSNAIVLPAGAGDEETSKTAQPAAIEKWQNWPVSIPEFPVDAQGMIDAPLHEVLAKTAARNRVTYLGDDVSMRSSRLLLQNSATALRDARVNTLFVDFIHQEDNEALQQFMQTGDSQTFVASLGPHSSNDPGLIRTLEAFRRVGINAIGINVIADPQSDFQARLQERNLAWATMINDTLEAEPDTKAVVLGSAGHFDLSGYATSVSSVLPGPVITFEDPRYVDVLSPGRAAYCTTGFSNIVIDSSLGLADPRMIRAIYP